MKKAVVITGDVISSSTLKATQRKRLQQALDAAFAAAGQQVPGFRAEQFRGDSFQAVLVKQPATALQASLIILAALWKKGFRARLAIGTGEISFTSKNIVTSDGSAFRHSGPMLDELKKKNGLLAIVTPHPAVNQEWDIHSQVLSFLAERWSPLQAEAVLEQLNGLTQAQTAEKLHIRQPAVHQRLQAAGWHVADLIVKRFEQQILTMF
ncbi:hypothetical protein DLD77_01000 [Chitinophaga alhagiae]|uniref:MarR family transcriptional regulator n=1 Tax=Chitinophaga alhagiae TaxID=2203219 RepID=A0ABM6W8V7_9BACT|nr:hypothetical protein [Chitinophaga alhagiae]AWO00382.1 hypothetical protein DLD77_01000 [Chitinophaga alhagiae]